MKDDKLDQLARIWGMSVELMLKTYQSDSLVPGICMNEGCDFATEVEPDTRASWCEECRNRTVTSALVLAGRI